MGIVVYCISTLHRRSGIFPQETFRHLNLLPGFIFSLWALPGFIFFAGRTWQYLTPFIRRRKYVVGFNFVLESDEWKKFLLANFLIYSIQCAVSNLAPVARAKEHSILLAHIPDDAWLCQLCVIVSQMKGSLWQAWRGILCSLSATIYTGINRLVSVTKLVFWWIPCM